MRARVRGWVTALAAALLLAGCGGAAGGERADGPAGLANPGPLASSAPSAAGQVPSGQVPAGQVPAGQAPAGQAQSTAAGEGDPGADIRAENAKPGTKDWKVAREAKKREIEGFADRISVLPGESFRLFVSTTAPEFTVRAFRTGWYGGDLAREVWASPALLGAKQAPAKLVEKTLTVVAPWDPTLTVDTKDWPPGSYLLRLDAATGKQSYVPLVVRSPSLVGRVVLMKAVTTEQAYNTWGGRSLYEGPDGEFDTRSRAVSFDRPYEGAKGAALFFHDEQGLIAVAEKAGLPLGYVTNIELDADVKLLDGARALISPGHDEYWSRAMRDTAERAVERGVNLAFFGANEIYRKIRFAPTELGDRRLVISYKVISEDPLYGKDDDLVTGNWRDRPNADPESSLTGVMYRCFPGNDPLVITNPKNWIWAGTGAKKGTSLRGVVGVEYDSVDLDFTTPRPIEIVARSPAICNGKAATADTAYHVRPSGAGVFAASTMRWVCAMQTGCGGAADPKAKPILRRATENILRAFAKGPAGYDHPATDFKTGEVSKPTATPTP